MPVASTLQDVDKLGKIVVILDVFRSSNTILALLQAGAECVVPVLEIDIAMSLKKKHPEWVALGERGGIKLDGFDGDNSPSFTPETIVGKTVVLTTSGGTRCINACSQDQQAIIGSFANISAIINTVRNYPPSTISFWAVGVAGTKSAVEDEECAREMENRLLGLPYDPSATDRAIRNGPGAEQLRQQNKLDDLEYCCSRDITTLVPKLRKLPNKLVGFTC